MKRKIKLAIYRIIEFVLRPREWTSDDNYHQGWWPNLKQNIRYRIVKRIWYWAVDWKFR